MQEIRNKLTRPKTKQKSLSWTEEEKEQFEKLKIAAAEAMEVGIERMIRDKIDDKPLVLTSDWSRKGTGFELHIVSCECHTRNEGVYRHGCCQDGWRLAYAGGRFNTRSEANYAPVEGELLGIAIALDKSRFLTYGHPNLVVLTDHKPAGRILEQPLRQGDRQQENVEPAEKNGELQIHYAVHSWQ